MKKLIMIFLTCVALLIPLAAFAQQEWYRSFEFEEYFSLFDMDCEVWVNEETGVINVEDVNWQDINDVVYGASYLLGLIDFLLEDEGISFRESGLNAIIYSFFDIQDHTVDRYTWPNKRYDFYMQREWLIEFYALPNRKQSSMFVDLFNSFYYDWFPPEQQRLLK